MVRMLLVALAAMGCSSPSERKDPVKSRPLEKPQTRTSVPSTSDAAPSPPTTSAGQAQKGILSRPPITLGAVVSDPQLALLRFGMPEEEVAPLIEELGGEASPLSGEYNLADPHATAQFSFDLCGRLDGVTIAVVSRPDVNDRVATVIGRLGPPKATKHDGDDRVRVWWFRDAHARVLVRESKVEDTASIEITRYLPLEILFGKGTGFGFGGLDGLRPGMRAQQLNKIAVAGGCVEGDQEKSILVHAPPLAGLADSDWEETFILDFAFGNAGLVGYSFDIEEASAKAEGLAIPELIRQTLGVRAVERDGITVYRKDATTIEVEQVDQLFRISVCFEKGGCSKTDGQPPQQAD